MKNLHKLILLLLFLVGVSAKIAENEITLFSSTGDATAYIDVDDEDLTIYMWNGTPVAYLMADDNAFNIYGFNGKHLGWYEKGVVRDHNGYAVGFREGAATISTKYEPYKSYKKYKPYKSYTQYAPIKPIYKTYFSGESLGLFLMMGKSN